MKNEMNNNNIKKENIEETKRRYEENEDEDEDEDAEEEEKKMDKFYELMRRFREERNRLRSELFNDLQKKNKKIRSSSSSSSPSLSLSPSTTEGGGGGGRGGNVKMMRKQSSWAPSFQLEDFTDKDIQFVKPPLIFPSPTNILHHKDRNEQHDDPTLNLELAL